MARILPGKCRGGEVSTIQYLVRSHQYSSLYLSRCLTCSLVHSRGFQVLPCIWPVAGSIPRCLEVLSCPYPGAGSTPCSYPVVGSTPWCLPRGFKYSLVPIQRLEILPGTYSEACMWRPHQAAPSTANPPTLGGVNPPTWGGGNLCNGLRNKVSLNWTTALFTS